MKKKNKKSQIRNSSIHAADALFSMR